MDRTADRALLLTPPGGAAIAVVRLSGPSVAAFLAAHFTRPVRPGRAVHGELRDGGRTLDDPVVVTSAGGAVADLCLHGGPWVVRSALELARRAGFEVVPPAAPGSALPPEATDAGGGAGQSPDAVELEREMLAHLPLARTEPGLRMLLAQPAAWADLRGAAGAGKIDRARWTAILEDRSLWWLLHPPTVAIVGPANAGKSTLANQLFGQERSITADQPGTTRDWVGEVAEVNGLAVMLVDTPGLRETADPVEASAIGRARERIGAADLVVLVLDAARPGEPEQARLAELYPDAIRVLNKWDRAGSGASGVKAAWPAGALRTIATTGRGVDRLRGAIVLRFVPDISRPDRPRWWVRRQREWVVRQQAAS